MGKAGGNMRSVMLIGAILALGVAGISGPVRAQGTGFDPNAACGVTLRAASDADKMLIGAWVFGYVAATGSDARPVDRANIAALLNNVYEACGRDETRSLFALVQNHNRGAASDPGNRAGAEQLLRRFLVSGADLETLTAALAPTSADIAAVYGEPLASRLDEMYAQMFKPGVRIGPKPEQNALIVIHTTTGALKRRDPVVRDFPGGYEKVLGYIVGDYPIVRFKFVRQGEDLGLAFDGLIHVNGRWVLMPKPWRALE